MKQFLLLSLLPLICMRSFSQDVATPKFMHVNVDGKTDDWGSLNFYDDQTQLNFGLANDSNNIYLCFQTMNQPAEMKIIRAGMKIILSTKGKSKHEASIIFPLPSDKHGLFTDSTQTKDISNIGGRVFNKETFRQNFIANHSTMQVNGFTHANGLVPINDSDIQVAVNWDTASNLIYEVSIAKKEFLGDNFSAKDIADEITLNVEVNGIPHAETGNNHAYHGGGFQGGGMRGGGGMHGGNRGGNFNRDENNNGDGEQQPNTLNGNNNNFSLSSKASFKQKFVLNNNIN